MGLGEGNTPTVNDVCRKSGLSHLRSPKKTDRWETGDHFDFMTLALDTTRRTLCSVDYCTDAMEEVTSCLPSFGTHHFPNSRGWRLEGQGPAQLVFVVWSSFINRAQRSPSSGDHAACSRERIGDGQVGGCQSSRRHHDAGAKRSHRMPRKDHSASVFFGFFRWCTRQDVCK